MKKPESEHEPDIDRKPDIDRIYSILKSEAGNFNVPVVDLINVQTKDPFKVLVATILSARTNDKHTAIAASKLFSKIKNSSELERLSEKEIQELIYPVGFYKNKARFLKQLPKALKENFNNKIPDNVEDLLKLSGVGRKTANLVVAVAFNRPAVCVDTHVHKIMNRLGYVKTKNPFETEMALRKKLPRKYWTTINSLMVAFGQSICRPISPKCSICKLKKYCSQVNVGKSR
ncbi:MAG: endonuclease III [Candidatus Woesearchaeota archaeon]